jgi:hypothetical protein
MKYLIVIALFLVGCANSSGRVFRDGECVVVTITKDRGMVIDNASDNYQVRLNNLKALWFNDFELTRCD